MKNKNLKTITDIRKEIGNSLKATLLERFDRNRNLVF